MRKFAVQSLPRQKPVAQDKIDKSIYRDILTSATKKNSKIRSN